MHGSLTMNQALVNAELLLYWRAASRHCTELSDEYGVASETAALLPPHRSPGWPRPPRTSGLLASHRQDRT